jgi:hypothetical protein
MFHKKYNYSIKDISVSKEIDKCLKLGGGSLCNLPRLYYGIIKKEVLNKVKIASGYYFPGPSPDMANAFSAAMFTKSLVLFDAPLFIAGNSAKSAAGMGLSGKHVGSIEGNPMLPADCHVTWTKLVPKFWSGSTIWAESLLKSTELTGNFSYVAKFNFARLYADCLTYHREYNQLIYASIKEYAISKKTIIVQFTIKIEQLYLLKLRMKFLFINIYRRLVKSGNLSYSNINNVESAAKLLKKYESKIVDSLKKYESK